MTLPTYLKAALAALSLPLLFACATAERHAIVLVDVAADGRVAVRSFRESVFAEDRDGLKAALERVRVQPLAGRNWEGDWQTHAAVDYIAQGSRPVVLKTVRMDPLLMQTAAPGFAVNPEGDGGFAMRTRIRSAVTPYHVEFQPPPEFAVPTKFLESGAVTIPVLFDIDVDGRVTRLEVVPGSASAPLEQLVADSVRRWRFVADHVDGRATGSDQLLAYVTVFASGSGIVRVYGEHAPPLRLGSGD